jgi:putative ATP-dependent endonuclease of the OLD family
MQLKKVEIKNFRLLHNVSLLLERQTTVIVGRNNSGKTSLTEIVSRVLAEGNSTFSLEDFSCASHQCFWDAYLAYAKGAEAEAVRAALPTIEVTFIFKYASAEDFDALTDFVLDLNLD